MQDDPLEALYVVALHTGSLTNYGGVPAPADYNNRASCFTNDRLQRFVERYSHRDIARPKSSALSSQNRSL